MEKRGREGLGPLDSLLAAEAREVRGGDFSWGTAVALACVGAPMRKKVNWSPGIAKIHVSGIQILALINITTDG